VKAFKTWQGCADFGRWRCPYHSNHSCIETAFNNNFRFTTSNKLMIEIITFKIKSKAWNLELLSRHLINDIYSFVAGTKNSGNTKAEIDEALLLEVLC
jgi:hypothetical protein